MAQQQKETSIILISESFVKPKYEVEASKQPYHLSPFEIGMLSIDPIQKGLLFTMNNVNPSSNDANDQTEVVSRLLEKLEHSLSIALVHFYPLAGRLVTEKYPDKHGCSIYVDCNKGPGARLIHATALNVTISDIVSSTHVPPIVPSFFELGEKMVNHDGHTKALLSIQVTELLDGVFIGFTMNHSVVDGTSFLHFVNVLTEIFGSKEYFDKNTTTLRFSSLPIYNFKPWVTNDSIPEVLKLPHLDPEEFITYGYDPGLLRERIFHFTPTSLATLKAKANQECETHTIVISSFQALSALVWRSITRARNLLPNQLTTCTMLVGARSRFEPPLSDEYFGNFISAAQWACNVEELLGYNLGWVAMNLRKAIMEQDEKTILGIYQYLAKSPVVYQPDAKDDAHGPNKVIMGGSARFDMYGPRFGLGCALAVRMGYANKVDGKVTANQGREGKGSVDLEICLRPHFMSALEADTEFMNHVSL